MYFNLAFFWCSTSIFWSLMGKLNFCGYLISRFYPTLEICRNLLHAKKYAFYSSTIYQLPYCLILSVAAVGMYVIYLMYTLSLSVEQATDHLSPSRSFPSSAIVNHLSFSRSLPDAVRLLCGSVLSSRDICPPGHYTLGSSRRRTGSSVV